MSGTTDGGQNGGGTAPLWTGAEMIEAMAARSVNGAPDAVTGISIDTRTLRRGDAFFAIRGDVHDGHKFASKAMAAGASCMVVQQDKLAALGRVTVPLMIVPDVLEALRMLGRAARARTRARIIAVTGSAGKTTTKEALRHVLSRCGKVHASVASYNNHWGVPLTLARMPADAEYGVFEIGMNHAGEIAPLVRLVRPHIGMVTLIAAAHLGNFKDLDDIANAKAEIFSGVVRGGSALINRDDKRFKLLAGLAGRHGVNTVFGYGTDKKADVRLIEVACHPDCSTARAIVFGEQVAFKVGLPGKHVLHNMLGVLAACHVMGADIATVALALADIQAPDGRGRQHRLRTEKGDFTLVDESYNANPASVAAALDLLGSIAPEPGGRRIAVLGDMLELGAHSRQLHEALAKPLSKAGIDRLLLAGDQMRALADVIGDGQPVTDHHDGVGSLAVALKDEIRAGDVVMVKASLGIGFGKLIELFDKN